VLVRINANLDYVGLILRRDGGRRLLMGQREVDLTLTCLVYLPIPSKLGGCRVDDGKGGWVVV
jgi:hypothetical protein